MKLSQTEFLEKLNSTSIENLQTLATKMTEVTYVPIDTTLERQKLIDTLFAVYYKDASKMETVNTGFTYYLANPFTEESKSFQMMFVLLQKYGFENEFLKTDARTYLEEKGFSKEDATRNVYNLFQALVYNKKNLGIFGISSGDKFKFHEVKTWVDGKPVFVKEEYNSKG